MSSCEPIQCVLGQPEKCELPASAQWSDCKVHYVHINNYFAYFISSNVLIQCGRVTEILARKDLLNLPPSSHMSLVKWSTGDWEQKRALLCVLDRLGTSGDNGYQIRLESSVEGSTFSSRLFCHLNRTLIKLKLPYRGQILNWFSDNENLKPHPH